MAATVPNKPVRFPGVKTVVAKRLGATVRRGPKAVEMHLPAGPETAKLLMKAASEALEGSGLTIRAMDAGTEPGFVVVTKPQEK